MEREEKWGMISFFVFIALMFFVSVSNPKSPKELQEMLDEQVINWVQDTRLVEYEVTNRNGEEVCSFIITKETTDVIFEEMQFFTDIKACAAFEDTGVEVVDVGINKFLSVREMKFHLATGVVDYVFVN